jgi:hypothetical protein
MELISCYPVKIIYVSSWRLSFKADQSVKNCSKLGSENSTWFG